MEETREYDKILIKNLVLKNVTGVDSWQRLKSQPVVITVWLYTDISAAGETDHVTNSIHYGHVTKGITKLAETSTFKSLEALAHAIVKLCCVHFGAERTVITVEQPKALLHASASGVQLSRSRQDFNNDDIVETLGDVSKLGYQDVVFVKDLRLHTIIGVNPWEREEKQVVVINLTIYPSALLYPSSIHYEDQQKKSHHLRTIVRTLTRHIEASGYKTVEAFAVAVARLALEKCHVNKIRVRVEKPSAILFADASGLEVTRDIKWLRDVLEAEKKSGHHFAHGATLEDEIVGKNIPSSYTHTSFIALGSNVGDRVAHIYHALDLLEEECSSVVVDTSFLYETPPMYYTEQPAFLNGVCKILTSLEPVELLAKLKRVEEIMGRTASFRNAPRPIDLDILFYDDVVMETPDLTIPHISIQEREFVLWPLCDIAKGMEHPRLYKTCGQLLSQLLKVTAESEQGPLKIEKVIPIQKDKQIWHWNSQTYIMGILNTTPDSFSDGGNYVDVDKAVEAAIRMKDEGAAILDIGGMSTRPGADDDFPEEEEIRRVVPVIRRLREQGFDLPISIDTFRANVADAAVEAGATMINDISGGSRDPKMLHVMAKHKIPVCLMHMRGDAKTMMNKENTTYDNDDVVDAVSQQIHDLIKRALAAGVYRWNIIMDPGVGFAKTAEQDFELLRHLGDMVAEDSLLEGFPTLMGPSRKKFIGKVTGVEEAGKRSYGTAGAVAASVAGGANILRVHDVRPMWEVARVCDSVWKRGDHRHC
ncbi:Dihydropteroate synthase-like protein [Halteromyces radiatus]|uniref:Dihydropteroate synthase-like protein n=1 Tax=Halteromyces radiatus TaxID=101107 RepID=UPI0022209CE2|nr:Dihydropteroate synthase-like protein [Halteromyces radiatus]KAI8100011.1 Dihydropteroate synthase-like protein [Halteromyces radiatus]